MSNQNGTVKEAPGVDLAQIENMEKAQIKEYLTKDIAACVTFLSAIRDDRELQDVMSEWFYGRIQNWKTERDRKAGQAEMFGRKPS